MTGSVICYMPDIVYIFFSTLFVIISISNKRTILVINVYQMKRLAFQFSRMPVFPFSPREFKYDKNSLD